VRPEDVDLRQNCLSSKWKDLEDMVAKGTVLTSLGESLEDAGPEFRACLEGLREDDPEAGAAVRWALQARRAGGLRLVLQGLPATALSLKRNADLSAEEGPAICLDSVRVLFQAEPAHLAGGPSPVLFARDPEAATASLSAHPNNIREGRVAIY
jgi:hypothetical protein